MNDRITRLQARLQSEGIDAAIYGTSANMQYFLDDTDYVWNRTWNTGFVFNVHNGHQQNIPDRVLVIPAEGEPVLLVCYQQAENMKHVKIRQITGHFVNMMPMLESVVRGKKLAIGESCDYYLKEMISEFMPDAEFSDAEHYGCEMRAIKDEKEIAVMRELCRFTDYAMGETVKILKPGIGNDEVEEYINQLGYEYGCREMAFPPTVRFFHTNGDEPFHVDEYRLTSRLQEGSSISFDFGFSKNGYCTDFGRSFYSGKAPAGIKDAYKCFQEAQLKSIESIRPGEPMNDGFRVILDHMTKCGYGDYVRRYHGIDLLGHQVGIDVHEGPWLHVEQTEVYRPGMIFTIEPKFFWPTQCFMRIEDMILVTENGAEILTNFDRDLFELPVD